MRQRKKQGSVIAVVRRPKVNGQRARGVHKRRRITKKAVRKVKKDKGEKVPEEDEETSGSSSSEGYDFKQVQARGREPVLTKARRKTENGYETTSSVEEKRARKRARKRAGGASDSESEDDSHLPVQASILQRIKLGGLLAFDEKLEAPEEVVFAFKLVES